MNQWIRASLGALLLFFLFGAASAFSDSELQDVMNQIDSAAKSRDAVAIGSFLSDNVQIVVDVPMPNGVKQIELKKQQYLEILRQTWDAIGETYRYSRDSIQVESNGKVAQVVSVLREEFEAGGQTISSETLEVSDFAVENGKLVVVRVVGKTYVSGEPIPKPSI